MFLGLAVFVVLSVVLSIVVIRAAKKLIRRLTGGQDSEQGKETDAQKESSKESESRKEDKKESESESEQLKESPSADEDSSEQLIQSRFADARSKGITEAFCQDGQMIEIDPKTVADLCVAGSGVTYLEFNNRELAGEDYFGFNLIVEKDSRMVLTYNGQAVASITAVETRATAIVNGQEVEGTMPALRINTFPPTLTPGMVPSDLEKMLSAAERIKACGGDARMAADCMVSEFTEPGNVSRFKTAVDSKIQSKESARKQSRQQGQSRSPKRLSQ